MTLLGYFAGKDIGDETDEMLRICMDYPSIGQRVNPLNITATYVHDLTLRLLRGAIALAFLPMTLREDYLGLEVCSMMLVASTAYGLHCDANRREFLRTLRRERMLGRND